MPASRRLLIVEDHDCVRDLLTMAFEQHGFETLAASDGLQALEVAAAEEPDGIVLDIVLPGMDGWEVLSRLRRDARTHRVPVVLISAAPDPDALNSAVAADATFVAKPFSIAELLETVDALVCEHPPSPP